MSDNIDKALDDILNMGVAITDGGAKMWFEFDDSRAKIKALINNEKIALVESLCNTHFDEPDNYGRAIAMTSPEVEALLAKLKKGGE